MSRLDEILSRPMSYEDLAWMVKRIERYEKALKEISHKGKFIDTVEECYFIAEEALKDETK